MFSRNQGSFADVPAPAADNNSLLSDSSSVSVLMLKESLMKIKYCMTISQ